MLGEMWQMETFSSALVKISLCSNVRLTSKRNVRGENGYLRVEFIGHAAGMISACSKWVLLRESKYKSFVRYSSSRQVESSRLRAVFLINCWSSSTILFLSLSLTLFLSLSHTSFFLFFIFVSSLEILRSHVGHTRSSRTANCIIRVNLVDSWLENYIYNLKIFNLNYSNNYEIFSIKNSHTSDFIQKLNFVNLFLLVNCTM